MSGRVGFVEDSFGGVNSPDKVEAGGEGGVAGLLVCRAGVVAVLADEVGGFEFTQGFDGATAEAQIIHFHGFEYAVGIDDEGPAEREAFFSIYRF